MRVARERGSPVHTETGIGRICLALAPSNQAIVYALTVSLVGGPNNRYANGLHAVFRSTSGGAAGTLGSTRPQHRCDFFNTLLLTNLSVAFAITALSIRATTTV
jgi:hypothetical protein